jgi:hypothetical protein
MPPKTQLVTEGIIRNTPLPQHGSKYGVIAHGSVIDQTRKNLQDAGLDIERELYRCSKDGQIAQGIYHLVCKQDPDMGMMFAWANSYNRQMRFKCAVGGRVFICDNGMVSGDMASYSRIHKGSKAFASAMNTIEEQIGNASSYFQKLVADKEMFKKVKLYREDQASILGHLYAVEDAVNLQQVSIIRREMDKPSHDYGGDPNSAWAMYNHVTLALKESHPGSYLVSHQKVHEYFVNQFGNLILSTREELDNGPDKPIETLYTSETDTLAPMGVSYGIQFS